MEEDARFLTGKQAEEFSAVKKQQELVARNSDNPAYQGFSEMASDSLDAIVQQCQQDKLVWGKDLYFDGTQVNANADLDALAPRFAVEAREAIDVLALVQTCQEQRPALMERLLADMRSPLGLAKTS